jgi:hypothetical protein
VRYAIAPHSRGGRIRSAAGGHGGAMKDRNDSRDVRPRIGSPLSVYLAPVTAAGLAALVPAVASAPAAGLVHLLAEPLFWAVAGLALLAEIRPMVAPGQSHPDYGTAALTFCFAAFLYWGFGVGALLRAATILIAALVARRAVFRPSSMWRS